MKEIHTPAASNVNLLFQEISKNNSSKLAIKDENNFLTYNDLDRTVNNLAHWLKTKHHFEKNEVIAIIHERSVETVTAMLAILRIGGVFYRSTLLFQLQESNICLKTVKQCIF